MPSLVENAIKYGILTATSPIWWPVAKALWNELQAALWQEGGLIGRAPTKHEIPFLRERYKEFLSPLINESLAEFKAREVREEKERQDEEQEGPKKGRKGRAAKAAKSAKATRAGVVRAVGSKKIAGGTTARRAQSGLGRPAKSQTKPQGKQGSFGAPPSAGKRRGF